jgi:hypothetical protein
MLQVDHEEDDHRAGKQQPHRQQRRERIQLEGGRKTRPVSASMIG